MPEPNPVWGVHVVEGAVTAALVRRTDSGGFELLDAIADRAPEDAASATMSVLAVFVPLLAVVLLIALMVAAVKAGKAAKRGWQRLRSGEAFRRTQPPGPPSPGALQ